MKICKRLLLCALIFLFSCGRSKTELNSASNRTVPERRPIAAAETPATSTIESKTTPSDDLPPVWTLPLENPLSEQFGLIMPDDSEGVSLFDSLAENVITVINDTVQVQILDKMMVNFFPNDWCREFSSEGPYNFYKVSADGKVGWLWSNDFMRPRQIDTGKLELQDGAVSIVLMCNS